MSGNGKIKGIVLAILGLFVFFIFTSSVSAHGATPVAGIGFFDEQGECNEPITNEAGNSPDFAMIMTGDLQGCWYIFVETFTCTSNGIYIEDGGEIYVGSGAPGDDGTFETVYRFVAHFGSEEECNTFTNQIRGRCQHPIVAGSGSGDFEGVSGKLAFTDNVDEGNANYTGLLHFLQFR